MPNPIETLKMWLRRDALPLWATHGYDSARHLFHERLTFEGAALAMPALRLMVQARQIATYARATLDGLYDASPHAIACLEAIRRHYHRPDDQPGWIFSLAPDGRPADNRRDLYAHAFVLFAHAWVARLTRDPSLLRVARIYAEEVEALFSVSGEGYWDTVPPTDSLRRQNPHMHLLEAYLALFEVSEDSYYLDHAESIVRLGLNFFIDKDNGILYEIFDSNLRPYYPRGSNPVEPGHFFEWSWLLSEYMRLRPDAAGADDILIVLERLFASALASGVVGENSVVLDVISDRGDVIAASTRIWPQTEFMRALAFYSKARERRYGENLPGSDLLFAQAKHFSMAYVPQQLNGGWIDRLDAKGSVAIDHMPASSLYHIYGAISELSKLDDEADQIW